MYCPSCGAAAQPAHRFCTKCGKPLGSSDPGTPLPASPRHPAALRDEATVVHVLPSGDRQHPVGDALVVGRSEGNLQVPGDHALSSSHLTVARVGGRYVLRDLGSRTGTYMRIREDAELRPGDHVMAGSQVFRVDGGGTAVGEAIGAGGTAGRPGAVSGQPQLVRLAEGGGDAERRPVPEGGLAIGRVRGDLVYPDDPLLSGIHASIAPAPGSTAADPRLLVRDRGSRNGVLIRIREDRPLRFGDIFAAGGQVFRFEPFNPDTA